MSKELTKSLETYLLAIHSLLEQKSSIIVKDVAEFLGRGGATTADAIKKLKEKGYIDYEPYGNITLTSCGKNAVTVKIYRHNVITEFFNKVLDIEPNQAEKNAESIEYAMTDNVLTKLVHFMDFMKQCSCAEPKWVNGCKQTLKNGEISQKCKSCSGGCCCSDKN